MSGRSKMCFGGAIDINMLVAIQRNQRRSQLRLIAEDAIVEVLHPQSLASTKQEFLQLKLAKTLHSMSAHL